MRSMTKRFIVPLIVSVVAVLALGGCMGGGRGVVTVGGSTTVQPLSEVWSEKFMEHNPGVTITVQGGGSSAGVKGVAQGTLDIGAASREMTSSEIIDYPSLRSHRVAADGVAIIVHPSASVADMTLEEVRDVFVAGSNDTWTVISREAGSGTRDVFENKVMGDAEIAANTEFLPANGAIKQKVAATESAIGYLSLGYVDSSVKVLIINGVACNEANILSGAYPVMRYLNYITKGELEGLAKEYMDFCLSSEGQGIVAGEGYVPLK